ncbi:DUF2642 domain-containing protein [Litorihabitans aurantiacus]|uniref:Uncharacterized protein n=1 Tax=Litorihabitans aurantiacus TaxID=1930061 RepID=A0AA37UPY1_9MICO|nr:DUF2642 domain-containing protein [Litorihabitans aurantiacus]GMA30653.1 hypothetical protein GCM10025875_06450 [Litorihabitans aurantiacus]
MRWHELFEDLESQADAAERADGELEGAELLEAEQGRIPLVDRLRAVVGRTVSVGTADEHVTGVLEDLAPAYLVVATAQRDVLVPAAAVRWVQGAGRSALEGAGAEARLTLAHVLRGVAERERVVRVVTTARVVVGEIDRVGPDHVDVVENGDAVSIPFAAISSVAL